MINKAYIPPKYILNTYSIGGNMEIALNVTGDLEKVVNNYIKRGKATSKAEVVRMGLNKLIEDDFEDISDDFELEKYLKNVQSEKIKPKFRGPIKSLKELMK